MATAPPPAPPPAPPSVWQSAQVSSAPPRYPFLPSAPPAQVRLFRGGNTGVTHVGLEGEAYESE